MISRWESGIGMRVFIISKPNTFQRQSMTSNTYQVSRHNLSKKRGDIWVQFILFWQVLEVLFYKAFKIESIEALVLHNHDWWVWTRATGY